MKEMRKSLIIILTAVLFFSCSPSIDKNDLLGNWKVVVFDTNVSKVSEKIMEEMRTQSLSTFYIFKNDSTFCKKVDNNSSTSSNGKFELAIEKKILKLSYNGKYKDVEEFEVISLNPKQMELMQDMGSFGTINMVLKKE